MRGIFGLLGVSLLALVPVTVRAQISPGANCTQGNSCDLGTGALTAGSATLNGAGTALSVVTGYPLFGNGFTFSALNGGPSAPGSFHADANWGAIFYPLSGAVADFAILDSTGVVQFEITKNFGVTAPHNISSSSYVNPTSTQTLSGSEQVARNINISTTYAGSTSFNGNNYLGTIVGSNDNLQLPPSGAFSILAVNDYIEANAVGSRIALNAQLTPSANSSQPSGSNWAVISGTIDTAYSAGGTPSNFAGNQWALVLQSELTGSAANYWNGIVGIEADCGATVSALTYGEDSCLHAVSRSAVGEYGIYSDSGLSFTSDNNNVGWLNIIQIGAYPYGSPISPQTYIMQVKIPWGPSGTVSNGAGGIDLRQATWSGSGLVGGGFAWASPGSLIDANGNLWANGASLVGSSTGATLDDNVEQMSGTPTVVAGGSGAVVGEPLSDNYGDILLVSTVSSGAITGVSVVLRGTALSGSLPTNPVAFQCMPGSGVGQCKGPVTMNLTWALMGGTSPKLTLGGVAAVAFGSGAQLKGTVVASLPTCDTAEEGAEYYVTDATSPTYNATLTGGGTVFALAACNGSAWTAH